MSSSDEIHPKKLIRWIHPMGSVEVSSCMNQSVVIFDGICNLCSRGVAFIIRRDPRNLFRFAAAQSDAGKKLMEGYGLDPGEVVSLVLVENGKIYMRSSALLRIVRRLTGLWPVLYGLVIIPFFLRDPVYDFVARNRYKWFGKQENCLVPPRDAAGRFII